MKSLLAALLAFALAIVLFGLADPAEAQQKRREVTACSFSPLYFTVCVCCSAAIYPLCPYAFYSVCLSQVINIDNYK